jgi:uncharacterized membrane protein
MTLNFTRSTAHQISQLTAAASERRAYVDVLRGLLIAHMALDHASLMFNAGRGAEELAAGPVPIVDGLMQFLTRFTGVPVAPGFCFMAGFMIALTSAARESRGMSHAQVTQRLLVRGLVLIAVDAIIMGLPRAMMGFYSFMVLSSIGVAVIAMAYLRDLKNSMLLPVALAVLVLHPLLDVSALPIALQAVLHEPIREGAFRSLYPVIPWIGFVMLGFVVGRDALQRERPERYWLRMAGLCLLVFTAVRLANGFGNAYSWTSIASLEFWTFAKYPPDLAFSSWALTCVFASLAVLAIITRNGRPVVLKPLEVFGRVPFFFYVVHFYVLGALRGLVHGKLGLMETYGIWLLLLAIMVAPCAWYYRKKRDRPNLVTRYV